MLFGAGLIIFKELYDIRIKCVELVPVLFPPIFVTIFTFAVAIIFTTVVDSYMWQKGFPYWPELEVFVYNAIEGQSVNWGVMPFSWYFTRALPKMLLTSSALIPLGLNAEKRSWLLFLPVFLFVLAYSFLGHKEIRFIIYAVPVFNIVAAFGLAKISEKLGSLKLNFVKYTAVSAVIGVNLLATLFFTSASHSNYPGGEALKKLHEIEPCDSTNKLTVFLDNFVAQSGASRFGEQCEFWKYQKEYGTLYNDLPRIEHENSRLILEINTQNLNEFYGSHAKIATVQSYDKVVLPELFGRSGSGGMSFETVMGWMPSLGYKDSVVILKPIRAWKKGD